PLRPHQGPQEAGRGPRPPAPEPGRREGPPLRRRRQGPGRPERVLPAGGQARGVRPAVAAENPQPQRAAVVAAEHPHRPSGRPGHAVLLPQPHPDAAGVRPGSRPGGPAMNPFVYNPDWGWWIVVYFFLGGLAAGAYFTATLIDLAAGDRAAALARL